MWSGPTLSKTTTDFISMTEGGTNLKRPESNHPRSANGTRCGSSLSLTSSKHISTASFCSIIETRVFARARSAYGRKRIA